MTGLKVAGTLIVLLTMQSGVLFVGATWMLVVRVLLLSACVMAEMLACLLIWLLTVTSVEKSCGVDVVSVRLRCSIVTRLRASRCSLSLWVDSACVSLTVWVLRLGPVSFLVCVTVSTSVRLCVLELKLLS